MSAFDNIILPQQEEEKPTSLYATAFDNLNLQEPQKPLEPIKSTPTKYRSAFDNLNLTGLSQEPLQPLSEKYTVAELRDNKTFNTRAERFLEGLGSNEDIFEYLRDSEYSLSSAMVRSLQTGKWTDQQKEDYVYLRDMFRNADLKSTRERLRAAKDITIDIVADPLNLLSVLFAIPTMGGSLATRAGANELVKQGIKRYNVSQLGKAGLQGAKRPAIYGAAEGAAWVGPYEYFSQSTDIDLGVRDDVDWNQVGAMTALGGVLGGTVTGALGGISAAKYFDKQFKYANEQEALDAAKKFVGPLNEEDATKLKNEVEIAETIDNFNIKRSMTERLIAASVGKPTTALLRAAEKSEPVQNFLDVLRYDVRRLLAPRKEGVKSETYGETLGRLQGFFHYNLENSLNMIWKTGIFAKLDADQNRQLMVLFANPKAKTYKNKPIDPEVKEAFFGSSERMGLKNLLDIGFSKGNEYGMFALNQKVTNYFPHKISHSKLAADPEGFAEKLIKYKHAEPINEVQEKIFVDTTGKQVKGFELNQLSIDAALFKNKKGEGRDFLAEAGVPVRGDNKYALLEDATEFQLNQARQAKAKAIVDNMLERRWTSFEIQSPNQVGNGYGFMKHRVFTNIPDDEMFDYIETDVRLVLQDYFTNLSQGLARTIHFGKTKEDFRKKFIQPIRDDLLLVKKVNRDEVEKIIDRVEDMYGYATGVDIPRINNPILRGMSDWGRLTQQMAHLPLATISSITEPLLLLSRVGVTDSPAAVGEIARALKKETAKTFDRAIKGIQRAAGKKTRGIKDLEDAEWKELYETGLALEQAVMDRIEGLTGDALTGSVAKNLQNMFFKTNLLTQWTSAVQLASFNVGKKLIRRNIERLYKDEEGIVKLNATTKKYLQDQLEDLNVNPKLGLAWHRANMKTGAFDFGKAAQADFYTKDIVNGANRFTKEIILNPSAAEANRPLWFGNPAGQLLMQFAGYPTVFTNTILKRFVTDSKDYPLQTTPKILGTTMLMTAVAMMGNYIRSGGRNWDEQEPGELVYEGIRRWGGVGFWEYADRLQTNVDLGGGQAASLIKSFAGPLGQDAIDMLIYRKGLAELATTNLPAYSALPKEVRDALKKRGREADKVLLEFLKSEEMSKLPGFKRGGLVTNVSNVHPEPDEVKMRGVDATYNEVAGVVLRDEEDRLFANKGGSISTNEQDFLTEAQNTLEKYIADNRLVTKEAQMSSLSGEGYRDPRIISTTGVEAIDNFAISPIMPTDYKKGRVVGQSLSAKELGIIPKDFKYDAISLQSPANYTPLDDNIQWLGNIAYNNKSKAEAKAKAAQVHELVHRAAYKSGFMFSDELKNYLNKTIVFNQSDTNKSMRNPMKNLGKPMSVEQAYLLVGETLAHSYQPGLKNNKSELEKAIRFRAKKFGIEDEFGVNRVVKLVEPLQKEFIKYLEEKPEPELYREFFVSGGPTLIHPENKKYFTEFHNKVLNEGNELVKDGKTVTMNIIGIQHKDKEYLIPSYDPKTKTILSPEAAKQKYLKDIESGKLKGYDNVESAEKDRKMFYKPIVEK